MPKPRHWRKHKKRERKPRREPTVEATLPPRRTPQPTPLPAPKRSLRESLYADDGDALMRILSILPLFVATWIAGNFLIPALTPFVIATAVVVVSHYFTQLRSKTEVVFLRELQLLCLAVDVVLVLALYSVTESVPLAGTLLAVLPTLLVIDRFPRDTPRAILLECAVLVLRASLLSLLGIGLQLTAIKQPLLLPHAVFGFIPGMLAGAALIARFAGVFEKAGWQRNRTATTKDGSERIRPAGLCQVFSIFLLLPPAIPVALVPFGYFPSPFLVLAFVLYPIPKLLEDFLHRRERDGVIAVRTLNLTVLCTGLLLLIGLLL